MKALITTSGAGGGAGVTHLFPESPGSTGSVEGTWAPFDVIISPLSRDAEGLRRTGGARAGLEHQCHTGSLFSTGEAAVIDGHSLDSLPDRQRPVPAPRAAPPALTTAVPSPAAFGHDGHGRGQGWTPAMRPGSRREPAKSFVELPKGRRLSQAG